MRKVIAFRAFNGRLFEDEQKCYEYEQELALYPKVKRLEFHSKPLVLTDGRKVPLNIYKYVTEVQERPNSQKETDTEYVVDDKYRFKGLSTDLDIDLMSGNLRLNGIHTSNWRNAARLFAEMIIDGESLDDKSIRLSISKLNLLNREIKELPCKTDLQVKVLQKNQKWEISNPAWRTGIIPPYIFTIERI